MSYTSAVVVQEVSAASHWHGWGRDDSLVCPQQHQNTHNTADNLDGDAYSQPWTGVTCTAQGFVEQLNLTGLSLAGNASSLKLLVQLQDMRSLSLANNNLTGWTMMWQLDLLISLSSDGVV